MIAARHHPASRIVALLVAACFAGACAKPPEPPPLEHVWLVGEAQRDAEGRLEGDLTARTTLRGALVGGGTGAVVLGTAGTVAAFITCAPTTIFYAWCVAVGVIVLGGGGLVVGAISGAIIGGIGGLPRDTAKQVNEILSRVDTSRQFAEEVVVALQEAVPEEKQAKAAAIEDVVPGGRTGQVVARPGFEPDGIVIGRLDEVFLRQHSSERLSIRLRSSMDVTWNLGAGQPLVRTCKYEWTSEVAEVEDWLLDDGKRFDAAFSDGIRTTARWMARDLEAFARRTELPKTADAPESCYRQEG